MKELFAPEDQDNKNTTPILEELAVIAIKAWHAKMVDPNYVTWKLLSEFDKICPNMDLRTSFWVYWRCP